MDINQVLRMVQPVCVLLILTTAQTAHTESLSDSDDQLAAEINYRFVGHLESVDDDGRLLVWEAEVKGDLQGTMKWWFVNPPARGEISYSGGRLSFYTARWELWYEEELLLAGVSGGKTNFHDGADGVWDGHGRVLEASSRYNQLKGRSIYETGSVIPGLNPPESLHGTGVFLIF